jgi:hypothetical protein
MAPANMAEIAPPRMRGRLATIQQIAINQNYLTWSRVEKSELLFGWERVWPCFSN